MKKLALVLLFISSQSFAGCDMGYFTYQRVGGQQTVCFYDLSYGGQQVLTVDSWAMCPANHYFCG